MKTQLGQMMIELLLAITLVGFLITVIIEYQLHTLVQTHLSTQKIIAYSALNNLLARLSVNQDAAKQQQEFIIWQQTDLSHLQNATSDYQCNLSQCRVTVKNKNFNLFLNGAL